MGQYLRLSGGSGWRVSLATDVGVQAGVQESVLFSLLGPDSIKMVPVQQWSEGRGSCISQVVLRPLGQPWYSRRGEYAPKPFQH